MWVSLLGKIFDLYREAVVCVCVCVCVRARANVQVLFYA